MPECLSLCHLPCRFRYFVIIVSSIFLLLLFPILLFADAMNPDIPDMNTQFDSELGWAPIKNRSYSGFGNKPITSNSLGFRSEEVNYSRKHVIIAGDSVVWGFGVGNNETIPYYLNELVHEHHDDIDVLNLGVTGYAIDQYYLYLKRVINKTNPVFIVVVLFSDDDIMRGNRNYGFGKSKPLFVLDGDGIRNVNCNIPRYSCFNILSDVAFINYKEPLKQAKNSFCGGMSNGADSYEVTRRLLLAIANLTKEHDSGLLFVLSPEMREYKAHTEDYFNLKNLMSDYDNIDFFDVVTEMGINPPSIYNRAFGVLDTAHYSPEGNRLMAETIFPRINESI